MNRRYKPKTITLTQEDIDRITRLRSLPNMASDSQVVREALIELEKTRLKK